MKDLSRTEITQLVEEWILNERDSMGRYARDNGGMGNGGSGNSYGRRYYRDGRSYDRGYSGADDMMDMFNEMMNNASDSKEREVIQKMMNQYGM